jgi:hypothetical protein
MTMTQATITLTVTSDAPHDPNHLDALVAAAREGFRVDGWKVAASEGVYGEPFEGACGNFEEGDPVIVRAYRPDVTPGPDYELPVLDAPYHNGVVEEIDPTDGTVLVEFETTSDTQAPLTQWVHHTSLELR